jgi:hypothetical protein
MRCLRAVAGCIMTDHKWNGDILKELRRTDIDIFVTEEKLSK